MFRWTGLGRGGQEQPRRAQLERRPFSLAGKLGETRANQDSAWGVCPLGRRETRSPPARSLAHERFCHRSETRGFSSAEIKRGLLKSRCGRDGYGMSEGCFYYWLRSTAVYGDEKVQDKSGLCSPRPTLVRRPLLSANDVALYPSVLRSLRPFSNTNAMQ